MSTNNYTQLVKNEAHRLGFQFCGISKADFLKDDAYRLEKWLAQGMHGKMNYMEGHFDKRVDPRKLVDGAKSVISLMYNYYTTDKQTDDTAPKISKYAFGEDYHVIIKEKLKAFLNFIQEEIGDVNGRVFVDSAPVLERTWAAKSGLGWVGKNGNLISKQSGSFFFLAEMILDIEFEYDAPIKNYCGTCTQCIDACPTNAILAPAIIDGSKCISYFTIELKEEISPTMAGKFDNWAFGCDVCQDVCPWNRFSQPHHEPAFEANKEMLNMTKTEWEEITEEVFVKLFKNSPLQRTKYKGLKRNLEFLKLKREA